MKKIFTICLLTLFAVNCAKAQNSLKITAGDPEPSQLEKKMYVYCQIVGTTGLLSRKVSIEIDYGQDEISIGWRRANVIRDENNKIKKFNSMVDALNYMAENGWRMNQAYAFATNGQSVYHFLMEQEITGNEKLEILKNLKKEVEVKN